MGEKKIITAMDDAIKEAQAQRDKAYCNGDEESAYCWSCNIEGREDMRHAVLKVLGVLK